MKRSPPNTLHLWLREVEIQKLHRLDITSQSFSAQIWMEFVIRGGAQDPHLSAHSSVFPFDANGKPTFKPSAAWYMEQVDYRNALDFRTVDAKIMKRGDDLVMARMKKKGKKEEARAHAHERTYA